MQDCYFHLSQKEKTLERGKMVNVTLGVSSVLCLEGKG